MKEQREAQEVERAAAAEGWKDMDSGLVFATQAGRSIDPANLNRNFCAVLDRAGLRRIRFHDLRRSTATLLLERGVELVVIKELLGHAHIGVTATVYAHVRLRLQRDAIGLLGNASATSTRPPPDPTTTNRRFVQHPSADVTVNYCRQDARNPTGMSLRRGFYSFSRRYFRSLEFTASSRLRLAS